MPPGGGLPVGRTGCDSSSARGASSRGDTGAVARRIAWALERVENRGRTRERQRQVELYWRWNTKREREGEAWGRRAYWFPRDVYTVRWESCNLKSRAISFATKKLNEEDTDSSNNLGFLVFEPFVLGPLEGTLCTSEHNRTGHFDSFSKACLRESTTRVFSSRGEKGREGERGKRVVICLCVCMCIYISICVLVRIEGGSVEDILEKGYIDPVVRDHWLWHATTKSCFTRPSFFSSLSFLLWGCFYVLSYSLFQSYLLLLFILFTCFCLFIIYFVSFFLNL